MMGSTPGRCTLTATSCPVSLSTALYTCPSEAAAMGRSEMLLNTSAMGLPSSSCKMPNACFNRGQSDRIQTEGVELCTMHNKVRGLGEGGTVQFDSVYNAMIIRAVNRDYLC